MTDNTTGFVECVFDNKIKDWFYARVAFQLENEITDKNSLAYAQRIAFYKYLGANMHNI